MRTALDLRCIAVAATLAASIASPGPAASDDRFIELKTYFENHPAEYSKASAFDRIVQMPSSPLSVTLDASVTIHVIYPGLMLSDYWRRSIDSFTKRMSEIGIPHRITTLLTRSGEDLKLQELAIGEVLRDKPDYLIFTLDALRHRGMIARVLSAGHTKVILQNITTPMPDLGPPAPLLYVGFDHGVGAHLLADEYIRRAPPQARYAIFYGPVGYVSAMRGGSFLREISARTEFSLVSEYYVGFDRTRARDAARTLLAADPSLDFIYAASTDIALGVSDALGERGLRGKVLVNGWGGGSGEIDAIRRGELDFTVMRMNDDNGVAMAEAIKFDLEGRRKDIPQVYSGAFSVIDQSTSDARLGTLVSRAFRYSR